MKKEERRKEAWERERKAEGREWKGRGADSQLGIAT